jgi:prolipoprotein diacylglyceryltransferase
MLNACKSTGISVVFDGCLHFVHVRKRIHTPFGLFFMFLFLAGSGRFLVEFVRLNNIVWLGLTASQLIAVVMMASAGWFLAQQRMNARPASG